MKIVTFSLACEVVDVNVIEPLSITRLLYYYDPLLYHRVNETESLNSSLAGLSNDVCILGISQVVFDIAGGVNLSPYGGYF